MRRCELFSADFRRSVRNNPKKFLALFVLVEAGILGAGWGITRLVELLQAHAPLPLIPLNNASNILPECYNLSAAHSLSTTPEQPYFSLISLAVNLGSTLLLSCVAISCCVMMMEPMSRFLYGSPTDTWNLRPYSDDENQLERNKGLCTRTPRVFNDNCRQIASRHHNICLPIFILVALLIDGAAFGTWFLLNYLKANEPLPLTPLNNASNIPPECYNVTTYNSPNSTPHITHYEYLYYTIAPFAAGTLLAFLNIYLCVDLGRPVSSAVVTEATEDNHPTSETPLLSQEDPGYGSSAQSTSVVI